MRRRRHVKSAKFGMRVLKAQVFSHADRVGIITAEEYGRAAFRYFVASLPIATGLLQHSASVKLLGSSRAIPHEVLQDARGNAQPITEWSGDHWRTRIAYGMPENPNYVKVKLIVRDAFALKKTGLSATGGKFGLVFNAGRSNMAEPEFVAFLARMRQKQIADGKEPVEYQEVDVARVNAITVLSRNRSMRGELHYFIDQAKTRIEQRIKRLK